MPALPMGPVVCGLPILPSLLPQEGSALSCLGPGRGLCPASWALSCPPHLLKGAPGGPGAKEWAQGQGSFADVLPAGLGGAALPTPSLVPSQGIAVSGDMALKDSGLPASHALGYLHAEASLLGGPSAKASIRFFSETPLLGALQIPLQSDSVLVLLA